MDVRRIKEEVDPDFLSDAHSRTGPAKSGDSCESNYKERHRLRRPVSFGAYRDERVVGIIARAARMCIDYLELSKIDLYSGCHQIRVHEDEIPKTTFRMRCGRYKFTAMPFWVDQYTTDFHRCNESGGARVAFEDELGAAEEREVSCEAQQGRIGVKRKLFESCSNNMGNEPTLALPKGSDKFVVMRRARVRMLAWTKREGDARTLIMEEAHATKYSVHPGVKDEHQRSLGLLLQPEIPDWKWEKERLIMNNKSKLPRSSNGCDVIWVIVDRLTRACVRNLVVVGILTFCEAKIEKSKMIRLELEQKTTKEVVIKERLKEAKDHQES
uniref:Reverse transcriptase domain-containing protein n=1 Tax=Tanacetum cinerariifolium TaxID=118510 RepID=A0A699I4V9_TANCI|nr:hypothetical protein [Tanacetum cinerariifolium]